MAKTRVVFSVVYECVVEYDGTEQDKQDKASDLPIPYHVGIDYLENSFDIIRFENYDGNEDIAIGTHVIVPDPNHNDLWNHSFSGTVTNIEYNEVDEVNIATVVDQDDNYWDIEESRLVVDNDKFPEIPNESEERGVDEYYSD